MFVFSRDPLLLRRQTQSFQHNKSQPQVFHAGLQKSQPPSSDPLLFTRGYNNVVLLLNENEKVLV